eukprot:10117381-Karenia_brevis.AAC.1
MGDKERVIGEESRNSGGASSSGEVRKRDEEGEIRLEEPTEGNKRRRHMNDEEKEQRREDKEMREW